jgi:hypothetical protein
MYTLKGEKKLFYKIQKQKLFSNKINWKFSRNT